ncbi:lysophospholipase L1-like esterase [Roseimicrobium gellanilyticum]|uniref:Lysophospholipase L1-like esterase n=1 Tax=Roseimicrobium gellanilyticum TaxID=748857 RepID=A0A366HD24_9BACT|nr:platelet-activating factor acetylhydrolase IB subunit [Roseimicrobium gellanilyticum]RBP40362.1 lysophospholipase L1-like esterase [Roseimicrobium gellanilyticum]
MKRTAALLALLLSASAHAETPNLATTPLQRPEPGPQARHEKFNAVSKEGKAELVFLGDSITQGWEGAGKAAWEKTWAPLNAANFGIGGDRTENVLWRLENGNFDGLKPKAIVLMIGTNNTGHQKPDGYQSPAKNTAEGVKLILEKLKAKAPQAKILVLAIFPRGATPEDKWRKQNEETNAIIKTFADDKTVFYMDIGSKFLATDGTLTKEIMPDLLHLSPKGYEIWAEAIEPKVKELLK